MDRFAVGLPWPGDIQFTAASRLNTAAGAMAAKATAAQSTKDWLSLLDIVTPGTTTTNPNRGVGGMEHAMARSFLFHKP